MVERRVAYARLNHSISYPGHTHLVQSLWWRHGSLDGQASHVLPALLQQRDEIIDSQHDVCNQLILRHLHIANSDTHAQHLLQLELNRALDLVDLVVQIFSVRDWSWELSSLGQTWTQETRNLLDESIGSDERIVLSCELLNELLVLVEFLEIVGGHSIDTKVLGSVNIVLVT